MRTVALIQARMGSTRLPGKILKKINGKTLVEILLERLKKSKNIDKIIVATSTDSSNDVLVDLVDSLGVEVYRGSENDVLDRFYNALKKHTCDYVVRITSDCPLIDPDLIDKVITYTINQNVDYGSNVGAGKEHFPDGQDTEVFKYSALEDAWKTAKLPSEREHVTPYIRTNLNVLFSTVDYEAENDLGHIRMTVDTQKDFDAIEVLVNDLGTDRTWLDYTNYIIKFPKKFTNQQIIRNEGYQKSLLEDKKYKK
jgi:spore coat polysaccharide biosynthesis protein SpsF (cytidylyltransferase family)